MSRPYNSNERENRTMQKNITLIYGDCSSPEIVTQAVRVLDKIAEKHGHTFTYTRAYDAAQAILDVFSSFITDEISDFNSNVYYTNPDYLRCSYLEGKMLA